MEMIIKIAAVLSASGVIVAAVIKTYRGIKNFIHKPRRGWNDRYQLHLG